MLYILLKTFIIAFDTQNLNISIKTAIIMIQQPEPSKGQSDLLQGLV